VSKVSCVLTAPPACDRHETQEHNRFYCLRTHQILHTVQQPAVGSQLHLLHNILSTRRASLSDFSLTQAPHAKQWETVFVASW
jgi:hypothetical protein